MGDDVRIPDCRDVSTRREFLAISGSLAAALALRGLPGRRGDARPRLRAYPFTLGVASGDPRPDGVVLWTRLAPDPLAGGGMPDARIAVDWEIASDAGFRSIIRRGTVVATPELAHSVHAEVGGLDAGRAYWYRFIAGGEASPIGRTFTAPPNGSAAEVRFAFCSCQHYEQGLYTAFRHMAEEDLQLVLHLGDYIYENGPGTDAVRAHTAPEIMDLAAYRARYALYKTDADLHAAHAAFPFVVTWDDHEVDNNYAGDRHERDMTAADFLRRRAAAYQAYWEHQPLRRDARPRGADMRLYRRLRLGRIAELSILDTRQYRTDQPCGDGMRVPCPDADDPAATMLGEPQRAWLLEGLGTSRAEWNVLAHQLPIAPAGRMQDGELLQHMDKWAGYGTERDRLLDFLHERAIRNPVSLVGDVHLNWLAELRTRFYDESSPVVGTEFVGTSISSGGDGSDTSRGTAAMLEANPHIRFFNGQRGYARCTVTPEHWITDYRVVDRVTTPGGDISTRATFVITSGIPGAQSEAG